MIARLKKPVPRRQVSACKALFLSMMPAIQRQARLAFRSFNAEAKQEAVQNVLCNVWAALVALAQRDKLDLAYRSVLTNFGIRQTLDHRIVGNKLNVKDPLSTYCRARKNLKVERLDHFDEEENCWREAVVEDPHTPVFDQVWFRCDFPAWLAKLSRRNRKIALKLAAGETTSRVSRQHRISAGRVSQLRRELHDAWQRFHGEAVPPDAVAVPA